MFSPFSVVNDIVCLSSVYIFCMLPWYLEALFKYIHHPHFMEISLHFSKELNNNNRYINLWSSNLPCILLEYTFVMSDKNCTCEGSNGVLVDDFIFKTCTLANHFHSGDTSVSEN